MKKTILLLTGVVAMFLNNHAQTITDIDGNIYQTITLGTQTWMAENLRVTKFNDGTSIPLVTDANEWANLTTPAYCSYNNTTNNDTINTYGRLYNYYVVNTRKLCPVGWHVPTDDEWSELKIYLQNNGYNFDGYVDTDKSEITNDKTAKSLASLTKWVSSTVEGTVGNTDYPEYRNKSGFNAYPGGGRYYDGNFINIGSSTNWWVFSALPIEYAYCRVFNYNSTVIIGTDAKIIAGLSVRCLKDDGSSINNIKTTDKQLFYPNPAINKIYLKNEYRDKGLVSIYDPQGKIKLKKFVNANTIDISILESGIYILKYFGSGSKTVITNKLIKK